MKSLLVLIIAAVLIAGCQQTEKAVPTPKSATVAATSDSQLESIERKKLSELEVEIKSIDTMSIEAAAHKIAQVDEWLYLSEDEKAASVRIGSEVEKLRSRIEAEIEKQTKSAIEAPSGKIAGEMMAKVNLLLQLYPAPNKDIQRAKLEQLSTTVVSASRRIEDIRRLRYNEWAITRIQGSLKAYRDALKVKHVVEVAKLFRPDREALISNCATWMSPIDPMFLEPSAMDLYNYVFGLTRDSMGDDEESRIRLTQSFVSSKNIRKTPADF